MVAGCLRVWANAQSSVPASFFLISGTQNNFGVDGPRQSKAKQTGQAKKQENATKAVPS
jgi:hypothetical protein